MTHISELMRRRRSVEGPAHRETKEMVAKMASGGDLVISFESGGRYHSYHFDTQIMDPVVECAYPDAVRVDDTSAFYRDHGRYPEMILDVGLVIEGHVVAGFEIVRSHGIDHRKRSKILASGILCICVKAEHWDWRIDDRRIDAFEIIANRKALNLLEPVRIGARGQA